MQAVAGVAFLFGAAFGLRLPVWVLVPAGIAAISITSIVGLVAALPAGTIFFQALIGVVMLQVGYVGGLLARIAVSSIRKAEPAAVELAEVELAVRRKTG